MEGGVLWRRLPLSSVTGQEVKGQSRAQSPVAVAVAAAVAFKVAYSEQGKAVEMSSVTAVVTKSPFNVHVATKKACDGIGRPLGDHFGGHAAALEALGWRGGSLPGRGRQVVCGGGGCCCCCTEMAAPLGPPAGSTF